MSDDLIRKVFRLYYLEMRSPADISRLLKVKERVVEKALTRIRYSFLSQQWDFLNGLKNRGYHP